MKRAAPASFPEFEAEMLKLWDQEETFAKSVKQRQGAKRFRFYDGPPFTSGPPHYGHVEQSALKDAVVRYKTMRGYYVPRRTGIDTHGLPIEVMIEKELGFTGKQDILRFGIDKFNAACRDVVFRHRQDFVDMYHRLGRWDDSDQMYATLDDDYIESVWWVFAQLHQKGLVQKGFKSMPYCPRCATPLSNFEVNDGYKDDVPDPSVYVTFPLSKAKGTSLLVWTTTPWTLPANAALAVAGEADYVTIELLDDGDGWQKGERLILAKARLNELDLRQAEYKIIKTQPGSALAGTKYEPLYEYVTDFSRSERASAHKVYVDESVSLEDGTGILHVAPRYGETDLELGLRAGLPLIESADNTGHMAPSMGEFAGLFFKAADPKIIADLTTKGRIFAAETAPHTYPFCWRCETPLLYFAMPSWFVSVSQFRDRLVAAGQQVTWVPRHVKAGRFIKWLEGARDWAISRNRFWGAPMPIWVNEADESDVLVVSSLDELRQLSGHSGTFDLHRPGIDQVVIKRDGKTYRRTEEVFDCWFESGSMPYGQEHYPFEHKAEFDASFPADFVCEAIEQIHLWFYTLHVLSVALFDQPAYKNVVATGLILGADGRKLSKRLRNYPPVEEVFAEYGADVLRFFVLSSPLMVAGDTRLSNDSLRDVSRNVFLTWWNVFSFLATYATAAKWQPDKTQTQPSSSNLLDQWMLARLNQTIAGVTKWADRYEVGRATRLLSELIDDLSNWYLRRSRRRCSLQADAADRQAAFATLHFVLLRIAQLMAPWSPFVCDKMYRQLTEGMDMPQSVHLTNWPQAGKVNEELIDDMTFIRTVVNEGLARRAEAAIKVRQPLASLTFYDEREINDDLLAIIRDEVNVKQVVHQAVKGKPLELDTTIIPELRREGLIREVVRHVQQARKNAGLSPEDKIALTLQTDDAELRDIIKESQNMIKTETQAAEVRDDGADETVPVLVDKQKLYIKVAKR